MADLVEREEVATIAVAEGRLGHPWFLGPPAPVRAGASGRQPASTVAA
jgi:hypothetical protein